MMQIETPRLRLRPWIDDDFEPLVAMCAAPRVMEFFPSIFSREETKSMWRRIHEHHAHYGFGPWAMEVDGEFAGALGLNWILQFETHLVRRAPRFRPVKRPFRKHSRHSQRRLI